MVEMNTGSHRDASCMVEMNTSNLRTDTEARTYILAIQFALIL